MKTRLQRRVWLEVDISRIRANYRKIAAAVKPAKVLCVLKADAYGLDVDPYASVLAETGCAGFGVAEPLEALELVRFGKPVQILSSVLPDEIADMVASGVTLPVTDLASAVLVSRAAVARGCIAKVHFKIDTGMGRLGIPVAEAMQVIREVKSLPGLDCEGIFSHCSTACDPADGFTGKQVASFKALLDDAAKAGIRFKKRHIAASDAINNFPETFMPPFNMVRTGINLHGSFNPDGRRTLAVEPVFTLKARVAQVRTLAAGTTLGYGRTWCLAERTKVATVAAGYADGLPLALSNRGHLIVNGKACRVVGRVSMDYTAIDVSDAGDVAPGDEVTLLGGTGNAAVMPDDWAEMKGTHAYEILCSFGNRVERVYVDRRHRNERKKT